MLVVRVLQNHRRLSLFAEANLPHLLNACGTLSPDHPKQILHEENTSDRIKLIA
jgi:hypothetical protein